MTDHSVELHLKSVELYDSVIDLVDLAVSRSDWNPDDFRRALDPILNLGKIIGRRTAVPDATADNDQLIQGWGELLPPSMKENRA